MVEDVFHFPRARLVTVRAAGQRSDGADVDAHAAFFALKMIFAVGDDDGVRAAHADAERLYVHTFIANAYATETENTAWSVVVDEFRPLFFRPVNFLFDEAAGVRAPVAEHHVLQLAFAALVANRAVERVIRQQKFEHALCALA